MCDLTSGTVNEHRPQNRVLYSQLKHFTSMTITERNQKLYDLRKKLDQKRMELAWIETEIMAVKSEYDRQNVNLYDEMFGQDSAFMDDNFGG